MDRIPVTIISKRFLLAALTLCLLTAIWIPDKPVSARSAKVQAARMPYSVPGVRDYSSSYKKSIYYKRLKAVRMSGNVRKDILAIARSQVGYLESNDPGRLGGGEPGGANHTEYGRAFGSSGRAWCSEFASWCIRQAGVPACLIQTSKSASVRDFEAPYYRWRQTVCAGGSYRIKKGDLVLFAWEGTRITDPYLSHTAIITGIKREGSTVRLDVVHGNSNDMVTESSFIINASNGQLLDGREGRAVYIVGPKYASKKGKNRTLIFKVSGGKSAVKRRKVGYGASYGNLPAASRKGYRFLGWYTKKKGGSRVGAYMPIRFKKSKKLYAHWKKK